MTDLLNCTPGTQRVMLRHVCLTGVSDQEAVLTNSVSFNKSQFLSADFKNRDLKI